MHQYLERDAWLTNRKWKKKRIHFSLLYDCWTTVESYFTSISLHLDLSIQSTFPASVNRTQNCKDPINTSFFKFLSSGHYSQQRENWFTCLHHYIFFAIPLWLSCCYSKHLELFYNIQLTYHLYIFYNYWINLWFSLNHLYQLHL